jgi:hypothetical protein
MEAMPSGPSSSPDGIRAEPTRTPRQQCAGVLSFADNASVSAHAKQFSLSFRIMSLLTHRFLMEAIDDDEHYYAATTRG